MVKRMITIIISMIVVFSLVACGNNSNLEEIDATESEENIFSEGDVSEALEVSKDNIIDDLDESSGIHVNMEDNTDVFNKDDYTYVEERDLFRVDKIDTGNGTKIDLDSMESVSGTFLLPESVDIYSYYGTYAGYTKPDAEISSVERKDEWVFVAFIKSGFLIKAEDFDRVAVCLSNNTIDKPNSSTQTSSSTASSSSSTDIAENEKPSQKDVQPETSVEVPVGADAPVESEKYTPEEAVAIYCSYLDGIGTVWDPSIKEEASWGTGFIELRVGGPEWAGSSSAESYKRGNGDGVPWKYYYIEVTGSDNDYVYITEWSG